MIWQDDRPPQIYSDPFQRQQGPLDNNSSILLLHAQRFNRASASQQDWASTAAECVDFFEGRQWSPGDISKLEKEGRPILTINKISPLVKLVQGHFLNNQTEVTYSPATDGTGFAEVAASLSAVRKQISTRNEEEYIDAEVYLDGLLGGRGFWDVRLDFSRNEYGETRIRADDPFSTYLDPDGMNYDLSDSNYIISSRMVSQDDVSFTYGEWASQILAPVFNGGSFIGMPSSIYDGWEEITPWRRFGGEDLSSMNSWGVWGDLFWDWVDPLRKTVRMLDIQHRVRTRGTFLQDLETGHLKQVPDTWTPERIQRTQLLAEERGDPIQVVVRDFKRVRWTQIIGDIVVYDDWSPYSSFTKIPFFPYFRRGQTRGFIDDLLDPQKEVNKQRSERMNIIGRSSRGGAWIDKSTMDAQDRANMENNFGQPGFQGFYDSKNGRLQPPKDIAPSTTPQAQQQLEAESSNNMHEISGVNRAAMGEVNTVESGEAIKAKQRPVLIGLGGIQSNWTRSKREQGKKILEVVQNHYTEPRIIRITGAGNTPIEMMINERTAQGIINNVSMGNYEVVTDERSLSQSFLEMQFEELIRLKELGVPVPDNLLIDASTLDDKEQVKMLFEQERMAQMQAELAGLTPEANQAGRVGTTGNNLPPGERGKPGRPANAA